MRAVVKASPGPGFVLKDVPEPDIRDDEVLIRVRRAGVCGTDVHIHGWDDWARGRCRPPFIVGHEFAGETGSFRGASPSLEHAQAWRRAFRIFLFHRPLLVR